VVAGSRATPRPTSVIRQPPGASTSAVGLGEVAARRARTAR
jgi:hypothetical protein